MGLTANLTNGTGPTLRPGQRLRRSVAASPGPQNDRVKVAPVRKRRKRLAKKIAARFGVLHVRDLDRCNVPVKLRKLTDLDHAAITRRMDVIRRHSRSLGAVVSDDEIDRFDFRMPALIHDNPAIATVGVRPWAIDEVHDLDPKDVLARLAVVRKCSRTLGIVVDSDPKSSVDTFGLRTPRSVLACRPLPGLIDFDAEPTGD